jgi:hypothetical protein
MSAQGNNLNVQTGIIPAGLTQYVPPLRGGDVAGLAKKLSAIMAEVSHVEKSGKNTFQNYNYQRATDMAAAIRKHLSDKHIVMVPDIVESHSYTVPAKEGVMQAIDVKVKYTFIDGETGATISFVGMGTGTDKGDKAVYKAHTGALKYALKDFFLIPEEGDDPEADESTDKHANTARPTRATPAPTPRPVSAAPAKLNPTTNIPATATTAEDDGQIIETIEICSVSETLATVGGKPCISGLMVPKGKTDVFYCPNLSLHKEFLACQHTARKVKGKYGKVAFFISEFADKAV